MKRWLTLLALCFAAAAYGQEWRYTIHGKFQNDVPDGTGVRLAKFVLPGSEKSRILDSTHVSNNSFTFEGTSDGKPFMTFLKVAATNYGTSNLVIEPGEINITVMPAGTADKVGGTCWMATE